MACAIITVPLQGIITEVCTDCTAVDASMLQCVVAYFSRVGTLASGTWLDILAVFFWSPQG